MGLRMKNFDILGVHWKVRPLDGVHKKQYRWWDCLKREGDGEFANLRGAWQEEGGNVFEGFDTPMHAMV